MRHFAEALKYITEIIERGIKDHPGTAQTCYIHVHIQLATVLLPVPVIFHVLFHYAEDLIHVHVHAVANLK